MSAGSPHPAAQAAVAEGTRDLPPSYGKVWLTFARNSLIRDMSFRTNFIMQCVSSVSWALMNFGLYRIIYGHAQTIGAWGESEFFIFLGTIWIINSLLQTFFMPNAEEFSELIRTGSLDFALLKPIDTQFLISFAKVDWSQLVNVPLGLFVVVFSVRELMGDPDNPLHVGWGTILLYLFFVGCGLLILYSLMLMLAASSVWLGRNQNLYTFWFYITNFYRYPLEIYQRGALGWTLFATFTFVIPILVVANVPARVLAQPLRPGSAPGDWGYAVIAVVAAGLSLVISRALFRRALLSYRSASS